MCSVIGSQPNTLHIARHAIHHRLCEKSCLAVGRRDVIVADALTHYQPKAEQADRKYKHCDHDFQ
jgi:hypothetical protein